MREVDRVVTQDYCSTMPTACSDTTAADDELAVLARRLVDDAGLPASTIAEATGASVRSVYRWLGGRPPLPVFGRGLRELAKEHLV